VGIVAGGLWRLKQIKKGKAINETLQIDANSHVSFAKLNFECILSTMESIQQ